MANDEQKPAPAISSRRTLLQQSMWIYYFTIAVGLLALWVHKKTHNASLIAVFLGLMLVCLALPIFSALANAPLWRRILFPRKLKTTREGKWFIVLVIAIGFSAINSGDNLLYLILAMMLSFIISAGILSENVLKGLSLTRLLPPHIFAGQEFRIALRLRNHKKYLNSYSLLVEDPDCEKISPQPTTSYVFRLGPGDSRVVSYPALIARRGRYRVSTLEIGTQFPFNFFMKSMERHAPADFLVYPRLLTLQEGFFHAAAANQESRRHSTYLPGHKDFHSLHEYRGGDNPRWIHWRMSARHDKLLVKSFDREDMARAVIVLNNYISRPEAAEAYEAALSAVASVVRLFEARGFTVDFVGAMAAAQGRTTPTLEPYDIYRQLAELRPGAAPNGVECLAALPASRVQHAFIVAISPEPDARFEAMAQQRHGNGAGCYLCPLEPRHHVILGLPG